jgi:competence protein
VSGRPDASNRAPPQIVSRPLISIAIALLLGILIAPSPHLAAMTAAGVASALVTLALAMHRRIASTFIAPLPFFFAGVVHGTLGLPPVPPTEETDRIARVRSVEGVIVEDEAPALAIDLAATATAADAQPRPASGRAEVALTSSSGSGGDDWPCGQIGDRVRISVIRAALRQDRRRLAARRGISVEAEAEPGRVPEAGVGRENDCAVLLRARGADGWIARTHRGAAAAIARSAPAEEAVVLRALVAGHRPSAAWARAELDGEGASSEGDDGGRRAAGTQAGFASKRSAEQGTARGFSSTARTLFRGGLFQLLYLRGLSIAAMAFAIAWVIARMAALSPRTALRGDVRRSRALITLAALVLLTLGIGPSPTVLRVAAIPLAFALPALIGRPADPWSSLAIAAIVPALVDPSSLGDIEYQLAFAGTAAVLRLEPSLMRSLSRVAPRGAIFGERSSALRRVRPLIRATLMSFSVTLGTAPLVARHFGPLSVPGYFTSILANGVIIAGAAPSALAGAIGARVSEPIGGALLRFASGCASLDLHLAASVEAAFGASGRIPSPGIAACLGYYAVLIVLSSLGARADGGGLRPRDHGVGRR